MISINKSSLYSNLLEDIPDTIGKLSQLQYLDIGSNPFDGKTIPGSIGSLSSLQTLSIKSTNLIGSIPFLNNQLSGPIPESFVEMDQLTQAWLDYNYLSSIPSNVGSMKSLEYFSCYSNSFTVIPESIGELSQLQYLDLSFGEFDYQPIPSWIESLSNLHTL
ncbi:hypothetical protein HDU76_000194 [Blyttiomyces sp. JEL0837]|nr:hypothetical protein HDU76_000194 [Blyttiomyces sp. JEL0837]